jgi:hypothetical protein
MTLLAGLVGKMGSNLASLGGDLLGVSTSVDLFAGLLESRTVQNDLITKFNLRSVYGQRHLVDARKELARRTDVSIDRKSGILTIQVTDHDPNARPRCTRICGATEQCTNLEHLIRTPGTNVSRS